MFDTLTFWHWGAIGLALGIVELIAPGVLFVWFAIAAFVVGLLSSFIPMSWEVQVVIFGALGCCSAIGGRYYLKQHPLVSTDPTLNKRGQQYIGRVVVLEGPIQNGRGRVRVGDSIWMVEGPDMAGGLPVEITAINGTRFTVRPASITS